MKNPLSLIATLLVLSAGSGLAGPVMISVQEKTGRDADEKNKKSITQERTLTIKLTSNTSSPLENLKVKYSYLGRDLATKDTSVVASGEKTASLPARGTSTTVESEKMTSNFVERHFEGKKLVPASGNKLMGYAVQVFNGTELVGEYYSSADLKAKLPQ